jgi:hypothetical protein
MEVIAPRAIICHAEIELEYCLGHNAFLDVAKQQAILLGPFLVSHKSGLDEQAV